MHLPEVKLLFPDFAGEARPSAAEADVRARRPLRTTAVDRLWVRRFLEDVPAPCAAGCGFLQNTTAEFRRHFPDSCAYCQPPQLPGAKRAIEGGRIVYTASFWS